MYEWVHFDSRSKYGFRRAELFYCEGTVWLECETVYLDAYGSGEEK